MRTLYNVIVMDTAQKASRLYNVLRRYPHLRTFIHGLHLPRRVMVATPPAVWNIICRLISLIPNLQDLSTSMQSLVQPKFAQLRGPAVVLPLEAQRYRDLQRLTLYGNYRLDAVDLSLIIASFLNLRSLTLCYITLGSFVRGEACAPNLARLEEVFIYRCINLHKMDNWLHRLPNLSTLAITSDNEIARWTPRVFSRQRITRLEIFDGPGPSFDMGPSRWFAACPLLRSLRISANIVRKNCKNIPLKLDELWIDVVPSCFPNGQGIAEYPWVEYLMRRPAVAQVIVAVFPNDPWYIRDGRRFLALSSAHGVSVLIKEMLDTNGE